MSLWGRYRSAWPVSPPTLRAKTRPDPAMASVAGEWRATSLWPSPSHRPRIQGLSVLAARGLEWIEGCSSKKVVSGWLAGWLAERKWQLWRAISHLDGAPTTADRAGRFQPRTPDRPCKLPHCTAILHFRGDWVLVSRRGTVGIDWRCAAPHDPNEMQVLDGWAATPSLSSRWTGGEGHIRNTVRPSRRLRWLAWVCRC